MSNTFNIEHLLGPRRRLFENLPRPDERGVDKRVIEPNIDEKDKTYTSGRLHNSVDLNTLLHEYQQP